MNPFKTIFALLHRCPLTDVNNLFICVLFFFLLKLKHSLMN